MFPSERGGLDDIFFEVTQFSTQLCQVASLVGLRRFSALAIILKVVRILEGSAGRKKTQLAGAGKTARNTACALIAKGSSRAQWTIYDHDIYDYGGQTYDYLSALSPIVGTPREDVETSSTVSPLTDGHRWRCES